MRGDFLGSNNRGVHHNLLIEYLDDGSEHEISNDLHSIMQSLRKNLLLLGVAARNPQAKQNSQPIEYINI